MKVVKESSDELNPSVVVTTAFIGRPPRERSFKDYVALAIATCGVGLIPLAPGTWGSLVGVGLYLAARAASVQGFLYAEARGWSLPPLVSLLTTVVLLMLILMTIAGIWAATRCESLLSRKDPGAVVIDEVIGQILTFVFLPVGVGAWAIVAGFLAFRMFDIWKPYPIRRLESLEAGLGIMADDVLAGVYAATLMSLLTSIYLLF
ncbi:MAG TPA: phosphatidylglycerophosphatase A [Pyrinomonadaceae bacterium]|nr:phosphatidylglycerophosphatase A [Pyrinomonadaceae bacterium]